MPASRPWSARAPDPLRSRLVPRARSGARGVRIRSAGEQGLVVELGDEIDPVVNAHVRRLAREVAAQLAGDVLEVVPTYRSLLVIHDPIRVPRARLAARVEALAAALPTAAAPEPPGRIVRLPACYGGALGPDLDDVARLKGLSPDDVVALHAGATYLVYMLGFTPGFPYLGGMPDRIATPRLETPRPRVATGSIGIGGAQTGVYPVESPGGWRIIARTPVRLFDPAAPAPFLLTAGDRLRFVPVAIDAYHATAAQVAAGTYVPEVVEGAGADA